MARPSRSAELAGLDAVVLDTETTGLDVANARIVQLSAVRVSSGRVLAGEVFDTLIDPGLPIPPAATAVHGITDAMVAGAPAFAVVADDFDAFAGDALLIGQSIGFDLAVLLRETRRAGRRWRPPRFLDTKLLAAALDPARGEQDLDALAAQLGVAIHDRHRALGDALVTAAVFVRLIPPLAAAGVRTLADAEAFANTQTRIRARQVAEGWYDATSVEAAREGESSTDAATLARLDAIPYRSRVDQVMAAPTVVPPSMTIAEAMARLVADDCGALLTGDPSGRQVAGIVTGRDLLRAVATDGAAALDRRLETVMSEPLITLPADALLHRALARMQRLGVRRLGIEDAGGRVVGLLSLRDLLTGPAADALALDDHLSAARSPRELAAARAALPGLVRALRADGVDVHEIAAVISVDLRELLGRAAIQAERRMEGQGDGRPPVPYALLALDRLGRGECLLAPEHAHALVYASGAPDGDEARWFAAFGARLAEVLRDAGALGAGDAPRADRPGWCRSLAAWHATLQAWCGAPPPEAAAFLDFAFAHGDGELADELRDRAVSIAGGGAPLIRSLLPSPAADGDLGGALAAYEAAARAVAVASHSATRSTPQRLAEAGSLIGLSRATIDDLSGAHRLLLDLALAQQEADVDAGRAPSLHVDAAALAAHTRADLERVVRQTHGLRDVVRAALALV